MQGAVVKGNIVSGTACVAFNDVKIGQTDAIWGVNHVIEQGLRLAVV